MLKIIFFCVSVTNESHKYIRVFLETLKFLITSYYFNYAIVMEVNIVISSHFFHNL